MTHMPPPRTIKVIVNGTPYLVEVADLSASPLEVKVNGRSFQVTIDADHAAGPSPTPTEIESTRPEERPTPGIDAVSAPMPGNIVQIAVAPGDVVTAGQVLCTLEAMKMENAIRSPRDGVIEAIAVNAGQAVSHGDVLVTFK